MEGAQRTEIEDDYSFSTELGSAAAEAARSRHTFGKDTGYESTEKENIISDRQSKLVAWITLHSGTSVQDLYDMVK